MDKFDENKRWLKENYETIKNKSDYKYVAVLEPEKIKGGNNLLDLINEIDENFDVDFREIPITNIELDDANTFSNK